MASQVSNEILSLLPHRDPFLFVEKITELKLGEKIVASKQIQQSEWFFPGHFPGNPVMPGVIMIEALAQAACVLAFKTLGGYHGESVYFLGINEARFRRVVKPGETLTLEAVVKKQRKNMWFFDVKASVGSEVAVEAEIMAGIDTKK